VPVLATEVPGNFWTAALYTQNVYNLGTFVLNPPIAQIYQATAQSIPSGGLATALTFDAAITDTYGGHSTTVNNTRYTAQVAGYYLVIGTGALAANATGNRLVQINKNGSVISQGISVGLAPGTANGTVIQVAALVQLAVGDYIEIAMYQTSGGALNTATNQSGMTVMWIHA
jgi:hypothetical protein